MVSEKQVIVGAIIHSREADKSQDRKIVSRESGIIVYLRRGSMNAKTGEFGGNPSSCWISTICEWGNEVVAE